jgi:hypothetical protein
LEHKSRIIPAIRLSFFGEYTFRCIRSAENGWEPVWDLPGNLGRTDSGFKPLKPSGVRSFLLEEPLELVFHSGREKYLYWL